jgi:hypothetical protein
MKLVMLAAIVVVAWVGVADTHPGLDAIIVTVATALLLLGGEDWLRHSTITTILSRIGDLSYSLYLVHWPLFSFAYISYLGSPPVAVMVALVGLAVLLASLQYRYVEQPFLAQPPRRFVWPAIGVAGALLVAAGLGFRFAATADRDSVGIVGLSENCDRVVPTLDECRTSRAPTILLWGDSYAQHLVPGLRSILREGEGFEQATFPGCAPLLDAAQTGRYFSQSWAKSCVRFNSDVAARLGTMSSVRYVILASSYTQTFHDHDRDLLVEGTVRHWQRGLGAKHLEETVRAIQAAGKIPVIVGPTPIADFNVGACHRREKAGRVIMRPKGCMLTSHDIITAGIDLELRQVAERTGARLVLPTDLFCSRGACQTRFQGATIYRDQGHITEQASRYFADHMLREALQ